ncbi:putative clathrin assembly protein At2g25430 [Amborella trichopoda]|uniref:ENTH domain-containing protein n=1 Tax=Amborella trichopoda TaxID=13333 RepID=W1PSA9_AMBTC|nr:putative clathrin assembly protein At2g25430 [Amborella trichopoda]XP_011625907.1 putative clathrin assembly protein At2g25430 [Amborella trichopoda]XP_011625908.1 putative clathrin assembly protein At2g25430 [Amborella trichopoda]XP_011625909.1 putative clathrin assembly protein At2g25430 [Amborella trichopoda]ERN12912.1 hypothetical protein AMTR_s00050p00195040 [Amborella trichopoda]|eukprot:XP_006851331.1 putative clathrin assembly protein At2g25430 [Amborella trichopoda]
MAPSTIRKALGAVKDQTSIGLAKVASSMAPELDVAILKATSHDEDPADEKYIREILNLTSYSRGYVSACIATVSRRLGKTRNWVVALKTLMLVHRLLTDGDPSFQNEIYYATRRGTRLLNMSDFRDESQSHAWDYSAFVRTYALYLDERLELKVYESKQGSRDRRPPDYDRDSNDYNYNARSPGHYDRDRGYYDRDRDERRPPAAPSTPLREMKIERVLGKMQHLQQLLDRFLACRPTGTAKQSRMVLIALYPIVRESFQLYADICEVLAVLLDRFFDMEYAHCVKAFDVYTSAAKQIDELAALYGWCKNTGVARSSEYPEVQRISDKLLDTLDEFVRDRANQDRKPKSPEPEAPAPPPPEEPKLEEEEPDMRSIKALPAPPEWDEQQQQLPSEKPKQETGDLVNLSEDAVTLEDQANKFALALFSADGAKAASGSSWEAFPSSGKEEVTSAWQLAETGKAEWELALVESASNLSKQKATLAGGFDPLLLDGMYEQGESKQQQGVLLNSGGSASSVVLPAHRGGTFLALPAPPGAPVVAQSGEDPFAASLAVPPPPYVQMSDLEKKQQFLTQEQQLWQQYAKDGMQGQLGLAKLHTNGTMPYGMPAYGMGIGGAAYGMGMGGAGYYTHH